jgi:uncharacterized protein (DUF1810 family)
MASHQNFQHFISAQENTFDTAFQEIKNGRKVSHWMWFIFPQLGGLGFSTMSAKYAIRDLGEAQEYLSNEITGKRLVEISSLLLSHKNKSAYDIFGSPDDMKLRSSMTLFSLVPGADLVFMHVLDRYFDGYKDPRTLELSGL